MKIYCCYSEAHKELFENHFCPTLPNGLELVSRYLEIAGKGDFLAEDFLECIRQKVALILDSIESNKGDAIIWSDVDIRFGTLTADDLELQARQNPETSLWFQREGKNLSDVNTGFILMRCNAATMYFFEEVARHLNVERKLNEQAVINRILMAGAAVQWQYLPWGYYARSHGWPPPSRWLLYHANATMGTDSVQQKETQFAEAQWIQRYGQVARFWSCVRRIPRKALRTLLRVLGKDQ